MARLTPVHWKILEKVFLAAGFHFARQEGSHRSYVKPGVSRPLVVPTYDQVPVAIIRNNLKTAGISREEYLSRLENLR
jgi:predicted RNA binding protein YcfA (HicA-like mRNA interferase family)